MIQPHYRSLSDEALWEEYVDGSGEAFDEIRERYQNSIFQYLLLSGTDLRTAAEALGQILCQAATYRRHFEGFPSLKSWLFAIATQQAVPAHVPEQEGLIDFISELRHGEPSNREEKLRRALRDVRRDVRQPFLLVAAFGLDIAEAARACRFRPETTVKKVERGYREVAAALDRLED
jgi:DNA-directed RNA polymerase specialized sigma24 family protein